jgi:predicted nucleic acid-binding Zn ribbon protein
MLKIHAEEQWKYFESLSPDLKAPIQEDDAVDHQKHQESLSPNKKARIQEGNTTAHQKRRESLSRETTEIQRKLIIWMMMFQAIQVIISDLSFQCPVNQINQ